MLRKLSLVAVAAAWPHWHRHRPRPGAAMVGAAAGMVGGTAAAGVGVVHASSSVGRPIMGITADMDTAAAMYGGWFRPRGDPAGA
jgi:hypothetical protein